MVVLRSHITELIRRGLEATVSELVFDKFCMWWFMSETWLPLISVGHYLIKPIFDRNGREAQRYKPWYLIYKQDLRIQKTVAVNSKRNQGLSNSDS